MKEKSYVEDIDRSVYDFKDDEKDAYKLQAGLTPEIVEKLGLEMPEMAMFREALLPEIRLIARSMAGVIDELSELKNI